MENVRWNPNVMIPKKVLRKNHLRINALQKGIWRRCELQKLLVSFHSIVCCLEKPKDIVIPLARVENIPGAINLILFYPITP